MEKTRVGGIKLSPELILVTQRFNAAEADSVPPIYRILAQQKINIHYLSARSMEKQIHIACLVSNEEYGRIKNLPHIDPDAGTRIEILPGKGMLYIFPHRSRMDILGQLLSAFGNAGIRLYGYSSSISTLAFVIDYGAQQKAVSAISGYFELPDYHSPFRSRITFVEKGS